jgi:hypothetical protein
MIRMLKALPALCRIRVVLMSGRDIQTDVPIDALLRKPFDPASMLECIENPAADAIRAPVKRGDTPTGSSVRRRVSRQHAVPATAERCAAWTRRGLELVDEQATRIDWLRRSNVDRDVAQDLYQTLIASVVTMTCLEYAVSADFAFVHQTSPSAVSNW